MLAYSPKPLTSTLRPAPQRAVPKHALTGPFVRSHPRGPLPCSRCSPQQEPQSADVSSASRKVSASDHPAVEAGELVGASAEAQATASGGSSGAALAPYLDGGEPQRSEVSVSRDVASTSGVGHANVSNPSGSASSGGLTSSVAMGMGVVAAVAGAVIVGRSFAASRGSSGNSNEGGATGFMQMVQKVMHGLVARATDPLYPGCMGTLSQKLTQCAPQIRDVFAT